MVASSLSFLTPYWSGAEMMRLHLASIRRFHPDAPILVSKRDGGAEEMSGYRREFGIDCWLEDCGYTDAYLRLLQRCRTRYACIADHDTVLLAELEPLVARLAAGRHDLIGVEERVRLPQSPGVPAGADGWLRLAPGCTAANFLIFDWQAFKSRWGLGGVFGVPSPGARHFDFDYGIGQRLRRHHYLRPFHTRHYGLGNLLKDGETPMVWHQWYGSYRTRLNEGAGEFAIAAAGERAFLNDYPHLDLDDLSPAWEPDWVETTGTGAHRGLVDEAGHPARRWASRQVRVLAARIAVGRDRSRLK
ncbi:MAG: hypothetical protein AB7P34_00105 [Vicinamibacterales bacterium]